ncbi:hypothetical protein EAO27_18440 [Sphingopyxis sp. YF1]|uniref:sensor histidine kinase n=1 Tax=Sphingopyxis sp. YF1 TaxID=2482763 RepID=UPI001F61E01F|nr:sensor histidine kinase [Sphingopyxis sp. YF1]UNU44465.1 hypothetical protein EAO27_18440 [Sphingopyxis sp. YF1]
MKTSAPKTLRHRAALLLLGMSLVAGLPPADKPAFALDPDRGIDQYRHTRWTRDDGAPAPIHAIAQTRDGYLWLASGDGLFRFDGIAFERMDADVEDATGGPRTLLVTKNGDLWTSYSASGRFAVYRRGKLSFVPTPRFDGEVVHMIQTPDGDIWAAIGQVGRPLLRYRNGAWTEVQPTAGFGRDSNTGLAVTRDGALWVAYRDKIFRKQNGSDRFELVISQPGMRSHLATDSEGRLWARDTLGVRPVTGPGGRWSGKPAAFSYPTEKVRRGFTIRFDKDGNLWVARRGDGIERLRLPSALGPGHAPAPSTEFLAADGLTSDATLAVFEDREGNIWVATSLGLDRFRNANVATEKALTKPAAFGDILHVARDGSVIIAQADSIYRARAHAAPELLEGGTAEPEAVCDGPGGAIWVVLADRILAISGTSRRSLARPSGTETGIYACGLDRWGRMWMTAAGSGLYRQTASGWFNIPAKPEKQEFYPTQLVRDPAQGDVWMIWGTDRFARLEAEGQTLVTANRPSLGTIYTMAPAQTGILIAGADRIGRLKDGRITALGFDRVPGLRGVNGIAQTATGETWALGYQGFVRMRSADFERALTDPQFTAPHRVFDFVDGLPDRYARQSMQSLVQGGDGRIWGATLAGTVWIDPAHIQANKLPPPVAIGTLIAGGVKYFDPDQVRLPAGSSSLTFGFAALSLGVPERVQIRYRLEGQDADWIDPGGRRQASYTNLGPGTYRFRVIAANEDGIWNRKGAVLEVTIPPTFLQSIWFKMLAALVLLALGAAAYLFRVRQLEARLQGRFDVRIAERERIARELHDTLLQGFQALMLQFKAGVNRLPASERKPLDEALARAQGVLVEGRDRVRDLRAPRSDAGLETVLLDLARDITAGSGIDVRMASEGTPHGLHPIAFEEIERICEEAIRNVVHHSEAGTLRIDLLWGARDLKLALRDDGKGIPEDVASQGSRSGHYGLVGMRERAERIGADLTVSSRPGSGTEVVLSIPAAAAYGGRPPGLFERLRSLFPLRKHKP